VVITASFARAVGVVVVVTKVNLIHSRICEEEFGR